MDSADPHLGEKLRTLLSEENVQVVNRAHQVEDENLIARGEFLGLLGVKGEAGLAKAAKSWTVTRENCAYQILRMKAYKGAFYPNEVANRSIEQSMPLDRAVSFLIDELRPSA